MSAIPVAKTTAPVVAQVLPCERHPGLQLDKYAEVKWLPAQEARWDQKDQRATLERVIETRGFPEFLAQLHARRAATLAELGATRFRATTAGPLTLHLARASALENAGICLHPLYGFVYLPASGLKGMARAYAETIWLATQPDPASAWRRIESVFGWAPGSDRGKDHWKPRGVAGPEVDASAGDVVFQDSWPITWPELMLDVVNCHHPEYYKGKDEPGDWEGPQPVSFLAIRAGVEFDFALHPRRTGTDADAEQAREWLSAALAQEGAGAKTAAGYGRFTVVGVSASSPKSARRESFEVVLELATPAFLAGATQDGSDCDLRSATLRGLLRWWWRTMHSGFLDSVKLRRLESAVWGDTKVGGAVRVFVSAVKPIVRKQLDRKRVSVESSLPRRGDRPSPGLVYHSYGMEDGERAQRPRWYAVPGNRWQVQLVARAGWLLLPPRRKGEEPQWAEVPTTLVLEQAQAALWLLCRFGAVGSKSRKGFGCFQDVDFAGLNLGECRSAAARLRAHCECDAPFDRAGANSPAIGEKGVIEPLERPWTAKDPWQAVASLGGCTQQYAQSRKHDPKKAALGLPRKIHGPMARPLDHQDPAKHQPPLSLRCEKGERFASPIHYHLSRSKDGWLLRVIAFPSRFLPDSPAVLQDLLRHVEDYSLAPASPAGASLRSITPHASGRPSPTPHASPRPIEAPASRPQPPKPKPIGKGQEHPGMLSRREGNWIATLVPYPTIVCTIDNPRDIPDDSEGKRAYFHVSEAKSSENRYQVRFVRWAKS